MRTFYVVRCISKSRVKEACVVSSEFTDVLVYRYHLCRPFWWNADFLFRSQDVKVTWRKDQTFGAGVMLNFPKIFGLVIINLPKVEDWSIVLCLIGNNRRIVGAQIN